MLTVIKNVSKGLQPMIPVNEPLFIGREKKLLCQCIDTGWISSEGPFVKEFEEQFSKYIGTKHGIAVANGTAALEVAMGAIGLKPGDEVILPTFTIVSCAMAVLRYGGVPVFVDSEPETWNMDVRQIEDLITDKTKAIMPVHIYGHPVDMDPIIELADKYGLYIVEDAAEVHGAEYKGRRLGGLGHVGCFSFYANKIITTGEGGMVVTNDEDIAKRAKGLRNLCFKHNKRYHHDELGFNYRMTNLQAALGVAQLENIERFIDIKRENAAYYTELLFDIETLRLPVEKEWAKNVYWMYAIVLDESTGMNADVFAQKLREYGVVTRPFFYPMHLQPVLKDKYKKIEGQDFSVSEYISRQGLYLPSGLTLKKDDVEYIAKSIKEILK